MNLAPSHTITAQAALALLQAGKPVSDSYVSGRLDLSTFDYWEQEVIFENCIIEDFACCPTQFTKPMQLLNCHFQNCDFTFVYFLSGLLMERCLFDSDLDFQAGGHNKDGQAVRLVDNDFAGFVNFFDCQYDNEVIITGNNFRNGTNLLGRPHAIPVTFAVAPLIQDNVGQLNFDTESA